MRILHSADWHIGDMPGPSIDGGNARAADTLKCIDALIEQAATLSIDLTVISGDVFHAARTWSDRGIREVEDAATRIGRLAQIAPVVVLRGTPNHDGGQHFDMLKQYFSDNVDVHIFTEPGRYSICDRSGDKINVCALPGFDKGYWRAHNPGVDAEDENVELSVNLDKMLVGMRALCTDDMPTVLSAHYTVDGCNTESGQTMMFSQFEPTISRRALETAGYDLCMFGHIHRPQDLGGNAFYSGAVNVLNFNDEGQERGFYVHEIENGKITSVFHDLPARHFQTLRLDENDIDLFNASGTLPACDVRDAIVRVLYKCTDEANKSLSRALMEKCLYEQGAFWVQEITPENIIVTISRKAMSSENDPEANLRSYLLDNGTDLADIEDMMPTARQIIASVYAKSHAAKPHGLFVPVEISVTNYRNYRQETFNFDDVRFCTINGQNGVGKSSLFMDAIYDALFEEPREGDLTGWICNDDKAKSGSITFTYRIGEKLFRVSRTRVKSGKGTLNLSEFVDGQWTNRSKDKLRDTQTEIERTIGMDGMTLRACALIMQDQYGLFLQADKESRMKILSDILGLGIYDEMRDVAAQMTFDAKLELRQLQDKKDDLAASMPDTDSLQTSIIQEAEAISRYDAEIKDAQSKHETVSLALSGLEASKKRADALLSEINGLCAKSENLSLALAQAQSARNNAEAIVSCESEILNGVTRYNDTIMRREGLLKQKAEYDTYASDSRRLDTEKRGYESMLKVSIEQRSRIEQNIKQIDATLSHEDELRARYDEYQANTKSLKEAREKLEAYHIADKKHVAAQHTLDAMKSEARAALNLRRAQLVDLERRASMLADSGCPVSETATCKFLKDAVAAKAQIEPLTRANESATKEATEAVRAQEAVVAALCADKDALAVPADVLTNLQAACQALSESATAYLGLDKLRTDRGTQALEMKAVDARISDLSSQIEKVKSESLEISGKLAQMAGVVNACAEATAELSRLETYVKREKELLIARERLNASSTRITELQAEISDCDMQIKAKHISHQGEMKQIDGIEDMRQQVTSLESDVRLKQIERDRHISARGSLESQLKQADVAAQALRVLSSDIADKSREVSKCDMLKQAFGINGIPHSIVRSVVPLLEATASNILGQMTGGKMAVELVTEKVMKSNNKKEVVTLDIIIADADTGRLPYLSRSGGERVKVALSIILALAEVKSADAGIQIGFRFIDEPPFLDATGVQAYCDALETIQRRYNDIKVMIITHDQEMRSRFPQSVDVTKDEDGSHATLV